MSDFEEAVNLLRAAPDSGVRVSRLRVLRVECVHNRRLAASSWCTPPRG